MPVQNKIECFYSSSLTAQTVQYMWFIIYELSYSISHERRT